MKKLLLSICLFSAFGFAQMTLKKLDGTAINDDDIITFSANTDPQSYLGFKIYNSSAAPISIKAEVMSIINADGNDVQFCFGSVCVSGISEGTSYPNSPAVIPANGQNGNFDHFLNLSSGTVVGSPISYTLRFYQLDTTNHQVGNSVTFTYRYSPNLETNSFDSLTNLGVKLKSNIVSNQLDLIVSTDLAAQIFDITGKLSQSDVLIIGNQTIDVSKLNAGVYFLNITNKENKQLSIKFIKN